jgi:hypothetical protein
LGRVGSRGGGDLGREDHAVNALCTELRQPLLGQIEQPRAQATSVPVAVNDADGEADVVVQVYPTQGGDLLALLEQPRIAFEVHRRQPGCDVGLADP